MIGKDILRFHCIIWPALLLAAGYEVPRQIFVHGFLLLDDRKISKSVGNVIDPLELTDVYGADAVRFWCARAVSFGQDGSASIEGLHERYERELGNDLGNLLSRTTAMIARYRDGALGPASGDSPVGARRAAGRGRGAARPLRHHGRAGHDLARRPPPEPVRRDERALAAREGREPRGRARRRARQPRRGPVRRRDRALVATCRRRRRGSSRRCARAPTWAGTGSGPGCSSRPRASRPRRRSSRASTRPPPRRDRHPRAPRRVRGSARAARRAGARGRRRAGSSRSAAGSTRAGPRSRSPRARRASTPRSGSTRTRPADDDAGRLDELRRLLADERAVAVGETGLDFFRDYAPARPAARAVPARSSTSRPSSASRSSSTRAPPTTRRSPRSSASTARSSCTASRRRRCCPAALERGWYVSFAGNVTYPKAPELREAAARVPADRILAETDSPYLAPQPRRGRPNEPANVVHTARRPRRGAGRAIRRARRPDRRQRVGGVRPP